MSNSLPSRLRAHKFGQGPNRRTNRDAFESEPAIQRAGVLRHYRSWRIALAAFVAWRSASIFKRVRLARIDAYTSNKYHLLGTPFGQSREW